MSELHILKSYRIGWINLGLFLVAITSIIVFKNNSDVNAFLVGLPLLIAGILAINGTVLLIKGRKERKSFKFLFAMLINLGTTLLLIMLITSNVMDIANFINSNT